MQLTHRERFVRTFAGKEVDRAPFMNLFDIWPSSLKRWKGEGLAAHATQETVWKLMGFDGGRGLRLPINGFIWPEYEVREVERNAERILARSRWGALELSQPDSEVMAIAVRGPVQDRASWAEVKERLNPKTPGRFPDDWAATILRTKANEEPVYAGDLPIGFFGALRELFGFETLAVLFYDDPDLIHEVLDTLCDLWIDIYTRALRDVRIDWFMIWEDMCYKGGPLISPALVREFMLPRYKRLTDAVREQGCPHVLVDSDGDERLLVPLWLEGGVNIVFPWERQFGLDLLEVRRRYPTMGIMGGVNKAALSQGREAIDRELEKLPPLLEAGYFVPGLDHGVAPDTSWDDYRYFHERLRGLVEMHPLRPAASSYALSK
jgi:uroporphyrinogen-III decarboxylase